ncbi:65-kDa microtubule-associated protein 1 [Glycine soja]|uniref:65-kDa microtubule-associated protein 1 n=2 Tax=Glycine soja TaxID=3848 RepID=A0A0B2RG24_GLYSO|nr:65-kDa microtubule-associated protein 1 [Glycine soja]
MAVTDSQNPLIDGNTCGSFLQKLQGIWDEVGESDEEQDKMLLQIEQECLNVYKRKPDKTLGTIKEQLAAIAPTMEQLWQQKEERIKEFSDVELQIQKICGEITGDLNPDQTESGSFAVDESDLSMKKLDEYQSQLLELQREKSERLHKVLDYVSTVHNLCVVLGMDFFSTVIEVHPSLNESIGVNSKSISNGTLTKLAKTVSTLKEDKKQRLHKLQELASQLIDMWNLMDTPIEERRLFDHVTCNISASVDEVTVPGALALDLIAEVEVERLDHQKAHRMKEIAFKKQDELEEIYACAHVEINLEATRGNILSLIDSRNIEPSELLADVDKQIVAVKKEALRRKEIWDKVKKWMSACEESWLEDYNRVFIINHLHSIFEFLISWYNASRGAHLNLKRAEKARILVNKIPALVDTLVAKTRSWEKVHNMPYTYDGVPLFAMLDEYAMLMHEREEKKRRMRDQKKYQELQNIDQEFGFGLRPSPEGHLATKRLLVLAQMEVQTVLLGSYLLMLIKMEASPQQKMEKDNNRLVAPLNYVSISKEDAASHVSGTELVPMSP